MIWWVLVAAPWALSLAAGVCAPRVMRHARPEPALLVLVVSGLVLAAASTASIALVVFVGVARTAPVASFAHWTGGVPHGRVVPPLWCSLVAAALLVVLARRVVRRTGAIATATKRAAVMQREALTPIVAVGDDDAYAYACRPIPFRDGVIFISDGLRGALGPEELTSVIAHERAHIEQQHGLYQHAGALLGAANPLLEPVASGIEYCLERIADERAAAVTGRGVTAAALARAALSRTLIAPAIGLAHAHSNITWRIEALLDERPGRGTRTYLVAVFALVAVAAVLLAAHDTELLFEAIRR